MIIVSGVLWVADNLEGSEKNPERDSQANPILLHNTAYSFLRFLFLHLVYRKVQAVQYS